MFPSGPPVTGHGGGDPHCRDDAVTQPRGSWLLLFTFPFLRSRCEEGLLGGRDQADGNGTGDASKHMERNQEKNAEHDSGMIDG
jgi:hypothetical protein